MYSVKEAVQGMRILGKVGLSAAALAARMQTVMVDIMTHYHEQPAPEDLLILWTDQTSRLPEDRIKIVESLFGKVPKFAPTREHLKKLKEFFDIPKDCYFHYPIPFKMVWDPGMRTSYYSWLPESFTPFVMLAMYDLGWYNEEKTKEDGDPEGRFR
jgi:hypothetical protein